MFYTNCILPELETDCTKPNKWKKTSD